MKTILIVFGTRPEAIKMCPLIIELKKRTSLHTIVCVTGQHKEMLDDVLKSFEIIPDYNLGIMKKNQTLYSITMAILKGIESVLQETKPDLVLVHGDTTSAFATTLASFYLKIPVGHIEAGLRTWNLESPFPEEFNRQVIDVAATYYFAPTENSKINLLNEGKDPKKIFVTGNTAIDALKTTVRKDYFHIELNRLSGKKLILITAHRRENVGLPMKSMFRAIKRIMDEYDDVRAIYPIHMNPDVRKVANSVFKSSEKIRLIEPLNVVDFHNFMARSHLILTDSGGIQEEAPSLGVPVLVMRDTTERPEGVDAGTLKVVGTSEENIYNNFKLLLDNKKVYSSMSNASNPYGDGKACQKIADIIESKLLVEDLL